MPRLIPNTLAPPLHLNFVGGGVFDLETTPIETFLPIDIYRGLHCPRCFRHILDLNSIVPALARRGVSVLAACMDTRDRAAAAKDAWRTTDVPFGYGLTTDGARASLFLLRSANVSPARSLPNLQRS